MRSNQLAVFKNKYVWGLRLNILKLFQDFILIVLENVLLIFLEFSVLKIHLKAVSNFLLSSYMWLCQAQLRLGIAPHMVNLNC